MCRTKYIVVVIVALALFIVLGVAAALYQPHQLVIDTKFYIDSAPEQMAAVVSAVEKDTTVRDRLKARLVLEGDKYAPEVIVAPESELPAEGFAAGTDAELSEAADTRDVSVDSDSCEDGSCVSKAIEAPIETVLSGFAPDGKPRFAQIENGVVVTAADVDVCLGHTHEVYWEGVAVSLYHYHEIAGIAPALECFEEALPNVIE